MVFTPVNQQVTSFIILLFYYLVLFAKALPVEVPTYSSRKVSCDGAPIPFPTFLNKPEIAEARLHKAIPVQELYITHLTPDLSKVNLAMQHALQMQARLIQGKSS